MVSVIVIAYNVEKYIERCIESITKQTFQDIEIILIDSSSTDKTGEICQKYELSDRRIKYFKKESEGPGAARNFGLDKVQFKYVTFVDGDDWLEEDSIKTMLDASEKYDSCITLGDIYYVNECRDEVNEKVTLEKTCSKIRFGDNNYVDQKSNGFYELMNICRTFTWGKLYKRDFLIENGFEQGTYAYEDVALIPYLIAKAKVVAYVNKPVYNYLRNRNQSLTNASGKAKDMIVALNDLYDKFAKEDMCEEFRNPLIRLIWGQIRYICIKHEKSVKEDKREQSIYKQLIKFMKIKFPDFIIPEYCEIKCINMDDCKGVIEKIVIDNSRVIYESNQVDMRKYILIKQENCEKSYEIIQKDIIMESEDEIWNLADEIFYNIWCNDGGNR